MLIFIGIHFRVWTKIVIFCGRGGGALQSCQFLHAICLCQVEIFVYVHAANITKSLLFLHYINNVLTE